MDDSLEALLEKATNPKNRYEDWEFIMAFCDKVNAEMEGPQVALKIIVPKIQDKNEKVALLALALLEACVKNCGRKFHQELGKFRFLNELIRMISPKYLGKDIPEKVQEKVKAMLYSWKIGLPSETKIAEAYEMLKKQGLVFDESAARDKTLEEAATKPKIALQEDPRQSQMLGKLIKSQNPEDLRAANRLIRDMVRRDEKRMEKLKKRLDDLELINNNVKLLNEMLSHFKPDAPEHEKQIIEELHSSVEKMRPQLFRMASELQPNEEGMTEILKANDSLIRVLDSYEKKMGKKKEGGGEGEAKGAATGGGGELPSTFGDPVPSTSATGGGDSSILLDLADLNFGNPPTPPAPVRSQGNEVNLLDDVSLALPSLNAAPLPSLDFMTQDQPPLGGMGGVSKTGQTGSVPAPATSQTTGFDLLGDFNLLSGPMVPPPSTGALPISSGAPPTSGVFNGLLDGNSAKPFGAPPTSGGMFNGLINSTPSQSAVAPPFGGPMIGTTPTSVPMISTTPTSVSMIGATPTSVPLSTNPLPPTSISLATPPMSVSMTTPPGPLLGADPLSALDKVFVPIDTIKPASSKPPLQVLSKGGVNVSLLFTENAPAPDIMVMVMSTISTNPFPISNYLIQAAAPKVMKVKLQPPTGSDLMAYNPLSPPASVSQIMLLANPTKAPVRLRFRISYTPQNGAEVVEIAEVSFSSA
ncbi:PREDICTED: ADP-ribosylation factor-binding protein GGA1-like [Amphimedon queenslandica]|uniref:VHS domain-containing protein n=1 Tax=Amphimedon queenslandica TaxID=400682 RepID=A0A1X7VUG3_AMPQE|nr:PREDICTED: ADP-ribosylation factor-binding protein GGA1-like [Amphimedon queenslandica]|eukprot:XP_019853542.1 PREDICTED: ADP-ribosylation factor-binding protein GGA1-like [Amphimedon queenslandica]